MPDLIQFRWSGKYIFKSCFAWSQICILAFAIVANKIRTWECWWMWCCCCRCLEQSLPWLTTSMTGASSKAAGKYKSNLIWVEITRGRPNFWLKPAGLAVTKMVRHPPIGRAVPGWSFLMSENLLSFSVILYVFFGSKLFPVFWKLFVSTGGTDRAPNYFFDVQNIDHLCCLDDNYS